MVHQRSRLLQHIPQGILSIVAIAVHPIAALLFCVSFLAYEFIQEWRMKDHSHNDLLGFIYGQAIAIIILGVGRFLW